MRSQKTSAEPSISESANQDPWAQNRPGGAPPDLDQIFRDAKRRFENWFGGAGDGGGKGGKGRGEFSGFNISGGAFGVIALVALGVWLVSGIYTVDQGEQAVEMRFGAYKETKSAGLRWHIPYPIEWKIRVNTQRVNTVEVGYRKGASSLVPVPREALMLTQDENIIDVQFAVQYDIKSPTDLLFNVSELGDGNIPEDVVRQATESAVREIVGRNTMDFAITEGRAQLAAETKTLVQRILDRYQTGINIRTVEMQNAQPPSQVKNAFDDVVRAREDEERIKNLAQAYANDIIPRARGFAARILQEAEAYKEATIAQAEGQGARFEQVLAEYQKAPRITRERLYLESMEEVLGKSSKMLIDQDGGNSVLYLPIDQLLRNRQAQVGGGGVGGVEPTASSAAPNAAGGGSAGSSSRTSAYGRSTNRTGRN